MSRIDDLIRELCPNGVEFKTLGEIGELARGNGMPKTDFTETGVGAIHYGQIYTYYETWATEAKSFVAPETAAKLTKVDPGDIIITNTSENLEDVGKAVAWLGKEQIVTGGHATVFKHRQVPKYISYWLQSPAFQIQKKKLATGTKVIDVSARSLAKVTIPIPPIEVQHEVVRILDAFSKLEAELEAELEARRKQYTFYRDQLLTFTERERRIRWARMTEVFSMRAGQHLSATAIAKEPSEKSPYPVFGGNGIRGYGSSSSHSGRYLLIGRQGALCGNVQRASGKFYATEHAVVTEPNSDMDVDFAFYLLTSMNLNRYKTAGAQPGLAVGKLGEVMVPVPPIEEQRKIARLLDKFDALVNDLSIGLPAERSARRKQYCYYRDRLLTFQEAE